MEFENGQQLINSFNVEYYDKQIENLRRQIENIRMGVPKYEGVYDVNSKTLSNGEAKKEIARLENKLKDAKKAKSEVIQIMIGLDRYSDKMEELAKREILLSKLNGMLRFNRKSEELEDKKSIYHDYKNEYSTLYHKSNKKIIQPRDKITKETYEILKKNKHLKVNENSLSMETVIRESNYSFENLFASIYRESQNEYRNNLGSLGLDMQKLSELENEMRKETTQNVLTWQGKIVFENLQEIELFAEKKNSSKSDYRKINILQNQYKEIVELSRETWYLEQLLDVFKNTLIVDSEMYKGLEELKKEQEIKLNTLVSKSDKFYERSGIKSKIDSEIKLREVYEELTRLKQNIAHYEGLQDYDRISHLKQEYYNLRYEMIKILKDNPELNDPKYDVDIESITKKEREILKEEIEKEELSQSIQNEVDVKEEIPVIRQTQEEKAFVEKIYTEEKDIQIENIELNSNLQVSRTMHYQNYMLEKVKGSDLGKISFSEYLEKTAPHLTELIKKEKKREQMAHTIYKAYIKYYAGLEDKALAIDFYKFAEMNYGISNIDIPIEYEEEYKGMKK